MRSGPGSAWTGDGKGGGAVRVEGDSSDAISSFEATGSRLDILGFLGERQRLYRNYSWSWQVLVPECRWSIGWRGARGEAQPYLLFRLHL
jgi:hypothetical protein